MDIRPKKSLGQHFLNSPVVLKEIIRAANIKPGESVLEIGPGTGILTTGLLEAGARLVAVEKDARSCGLLKERFADRIKSGALILHYADVLKIDRSELGLKEMRYALVANIPYYITGAILESFLEYEPRPNRAVLLVQREVADRIVAKDKRESVLSISVKTFGVPKIVARVPRGAFTPAPKVDSTILAIESISNQRFAGRDLEIRRFFEVVKAGFAHKRKLAKRNLESVIEKGLIEKAWREMRIDDKARAENISLERWLKLAES